MGTSTPTESIRGHLGTGIYSLADLRNFLAFETDRVGGEKALVWLQTALNPAGHESYQADYSFGDLVSLFVVGELLRKGVTLATIKKAEATLAARWSHSRPYAREDIATDGVDVFALRDSDREQPESGEAANRDGQRAMFEPIRDHLTTIRYADGWAKSWEPSDRILVDPALQFGDPVVAGTRVLTADVAAIVDSFGVRAATERLGLEQADVHAAVRFEQALRN